jgi:predicted nucleic acid-binding protein
VTTRAVLLEIGNALARLRFRAAAIEVLEAVESDPRIRIVSLSDELYAEALSLFRTREDKEWGMTDCTLVRGDAAAGHSRRAHDRPPLRASRIQGVAALTH